MSEIAGIHDLREFGAPGDIGVFQLPCSSLIFQFNFSGVTYTVALNGNTGVPLIDINAAIIINQCLIRGGRIFIKYGDYTISNKLNMTQDWTQLTGESMRGVLLTASNGFASDMIEVTGRNCHLENFSMWGSAGESGNGIYQHDVGGYGDLHLNDMYILFFKNSGVKYTGTALFAYGIACEYCSEYGWNIVYGVQAMLVACGGWGNHLDGLYMYHAKDNVLIGFTTDSNNRNGGYIQNSDRNSWIGGLVNLNTYNGIEIVSSSENTIQGVTFRDNNQIAASSCNVYLLGDSGVYSTRNKIIDNSMTSTVPTKVVSGIADNEAQDSYNIITGNTISGTTGKTIDLLGTGDLIHGNIGFVTENRVSATITALNTSIAFAHGCSYTPVAGDIHPTLTNLPTTPIGDIYIDTIDAANATLHCSAPPGVATAIFDIAIIKTP